MIRPRSSKVRPLVFRTAGPAAAVSLVVLDANRLLRDGIEAMIADVDGCAIVASFANARQTLQAIQSLRPTIVLLDYSLAEGDSLNACARIRTLTPDTRVVVMGLGTQQEDVGAFIRAGAAGFIMKDASLDEFVSTIRLVAAGQDALPRALTRALFSQIAGGTLLPGSAVIDEGMRPTAREQEVMNLLGEGLSNKDIAARLHIAVHTVKSHVHNILEKLSLHTRLEIVTYLHRVERQHER